MLAFFAAFKGSREIKSDISIVGAPPTLPAGNPAVSTIFMIVPPLAVLASVDILAPSQARAGAAAWRPADLPWLAFGRESSIASAWALAIRLGLGE
jgi:hypothetical protein